MKKLGAVHTNEKEIFSPVPTLQPIKKPPVKGVNIRWLTQYDTVKLNLDNINIPPNLFHLVSFRFTSFQNVSFLLWVHIFISKIEIGIDFN